MLTKSRLIQLLTMLSLLIGLFVWKTADSFVDNDLNEDNKELDLDAGLCDFSESCVFTTSSGTFTLSVDERRIIAEEWFHLTLESDIKNWKVLSAKTVGRVMFMGKIPIRFSSPIKNGEQYQAKGKSMLGACTENKMYWRFDIVVEVEGKPINLHYDFLIVR